MSHSHGSVDYVRSSLCCSVFLGTANSSNFNSKALAFFYGFVILSAFLIGQVVEIRNTSYHWIFTGRGILGTVLRNIHQNDPFTSFFDHGIYSKLSKILRCLIRWLFPICITAGGITTWWDQKSFSPHHGVLTGQVIAMFIGMMALFYAMSGLFQWLTSDSRPFPTCNFRVGAVVASVSIALVMPTIAIVIGSKQGPMTTNILCCSRILLLLLCCNYCCCNRCFGLGFWNVFGWFDSANIFSAILGVVLGYLIRLYMKYKCRVVAFCHHTDLYRLLCLDYFHLERGIVHCNLVSLLQMARMKVVNSSLNRNYQHLSLLFFTIAGAKLHLDVLVEMALFAFLLVAVRTLAFYIGCRVAVLTNADAATRIMLGWVLYHKPVWQSRLPIVLYQYMAKN